MSGWNEWALVVLIGIVVFGATRLPAIGEGVGKAIRNFKRGLKENDDIEVGSAEARSLPRDNPKADALPKDAEIVEKTR